jgi:hypothetical protein
MRHLIATLFLLCSHDIFSQKFEYGLMGHINMSSVFKPSKDSFTSNASWGISMFAERKINPQWSMSVNPGYQQVGYGSQSSIASWVTGQFEMPVKLHYAAPSMKNGRLNVGFNPSYQVSFMKLDPSGSNSAGRRNEPMKFSQPFNPGMSAGLDFKISDGFHFNVSYQYFMTTFYRENTIAGRPAHWQFSLQLRLNELASRKIDTGSKDTLHPFGYLIVLLPDQYHPKGQSGALSAGKLDTLLLDAFYRNFTYAPVIFVRETSKSRTGIVQDKDILYTIRGPQIDRRGPYAYLFVGEYFYKPSSGWHQGFFLLNEQSALAGIPFLGAYLFPFNNRMLEEEWSDIFQKKVVELNNDLTEKMK